MKSRQQLIEEGKLWQVYPDKDKDKILFEGTKSKCMDYITIHCKAEYKRGTIRLGKLILEL